MITEPPPEKSFKSKVPKIDLSTTKKEDLQSFSINRRKSSARSSSLPSPKSSPRNLPSPDPSSKKILESPDRSPKDQKDISPQRSHVRFTNSKGELSLNFGKKASDEDKFIDNVISNLSSEQKRKIITSEDYCDEDGTTYLIWSCKNNRVDIVKQIIIGEKYDINRGDINGITPLMWASKNSNIEIVKLLVLCLDINLNKKDRRNNTFLHYIAMKNNLEILGLFLIDPKINSTILNLEKAMVYTIIKTQKISESVRTDWFARTMIDNEICCLFLELPHETHKDNVNMFLELLVDRVKKKLKDFRDEKNETGAELPWYATDEFIGNVIKERSVQINISEV